MAKKNTRKSSKPVQNVEVVGPSQPAPAQLVPAPVFPPSMELVHTQNVQAEQKSDMLDIFLAKGEEQMTASMQAAAARAKCKQGEAGKVFDQISSAIDKLGDAKAVEVGKALKGSTFASLLTLPVCRCTASVRTPIRNDNGKWGKLSVTLSITPARGEARHPIIQREIMVVTPVTVIRLLDQRESLEQEAVVANDEALEWKQRLSQMNRLERLGRSHLAEERIRQSDGGGAKLDGLMDTLDGSIDTLLTASRRSCPRE